MGGVTPLADGLKAGYMAPLITSLSPPPWRAKRIPAHPIEPPSSPSLSLRSIAELGNFWQPFELSHLLNAREDGNKNGHTYFIQWRGDSSRRDRHKRCGSSVRCRSVPFELIYGPPWPPKTTRISLGERESEKDHFASMTERMESASARERAGMGGWEGALQNKSLFCHPT